MGPRTYLTNEKEKELVDFLLKCAKMGYAKTRQDVLKIVHSAVQKKEEMNDALLKKKEKKLNKISHGWWVRFCRRWPQLRLRKGGSFPIVRDHTSGSTTQITILACASASVQAIFPMVVFSGKNFNSILAKGEVPATLYGMPSSGWMDQELFANWSFS